MMKSMKSFRKEWNSSIVRFVVISMRKYVFVDPNVIKIQLGCPLINSNNEWEKNVCVRVHRHTKKEKKREEKEKLTRRNEWVHVTGQILLSRWRNYERKCEDIEDSIHWPCLVGLGKEIESRTHRDKQTDSQKKNKNKKKYGQEKEQQIRRHTQHLRSLVFCPNRE